MRVLMINRSDANEAPGGDTIQMQKTRQGLQQLGVTVDVRLADSLVGLWDYDLVHIFNIQQAWGSWHACQAAASRELPVVLSTIYWDPFPTWYWTNPELGVFWRIVRGLVGRWGYAPYAAWQFLRYPCSELWRAQRELVLAAKVLLPNSLMEAERVRRSFRIKGVMPRYVVVPNAVEYSLFDPLPTLPGPLVVNLGIEDFVLQVGRISPEKNQIALIEALWDVDVPIVFVGNLSSLHPEYGRVCRVLGSQRGNVHFVEWLPQHELVGLYACAAVHVLPSWRETPGLASLEAAAAGCRVVSTTIGSAYEYFGDEAWYCNPGDKRSIRRAILDALDSPSSERLRNRVLEQYTWDMAAEYTLRAYDLALSER